MRLIGVCGGRAFDDGHVVARELDAIATADTVIVHGGATGADMLAGQWARRKRLGELVAPANWGVLGRSAGPARNTIIAALPLVKLIAFPGGAGTADMVSRARAAGIPVREVQR